jgi:ATP-dependent Clp protease ATP-binding subunit ClpC
VFERFTESARRVVVASQEESRALGHDYIGTEHLLLGILRSESRITGEVLGGAGITLEGARAEVERTVGRGSAALVGQIPFTPRAKKVMELALREALALGHNHIEPAHLLLALLHGENSVAVTIVASLGGNPEQMRGEILGVSGRWRSEGDASAPEIDWEQARIRWDSPLGPELTVPLRLEHHAAQLFQDSDAWEKPPLAGLTVVVERGGIHITGESLLDIPDPGELRRALDAAVQAARVAASERRARQAGRAEQFLAALRAG